MASLTRFPPLFLSHGSPTLYAEHASPSYRALASLLDTLGVGRPRAVVVVSAHWEEPTVSITASATPQQIYDFYGFPREYYEFVYPAKGDPALADRVLHMLQDAGVPARLEPERGLDHGTWSPLAIVLPKADVPIIQVSLQRNLDLAFHTRVGRALAPLQDEGVLLVGSGGATHNLGAIFQRVPYNNTSWAARFDTKLRDILVGKAGPEREAALAQLLQDPDADLAHPTKEHLAPVYFAIGAGWERPARQLHANMIMGSLSMAMYAF